MVRNADLLKSVDVFAQVSDSDLESIAALLEDRKVAKDAVILKEGEPGEGLYIIVSGRVIRTSSDAAGREKLLDYLSEGQSFGEMSLMAGEPHQATHQAITDVRLLVLRKTRFEDYLVKNVQLMVQLMKVVAQRQAASKPTPHRLETSEPAPPASGKLFVVYSPKGGVGKSILAVNLAVALAQEHPDSVALLDLSLTFGHDMLLLNLAPRTSLSGVSADSLRKMDLKNGLSYYMVSHPSSTLRVLAGATRPEEGEALTAEAAKVAIQQLRRYFEYVVVDTGCSFTDPVLAALETADKVLVVCSPEIPVLRDIRDCQRIFNDVLHITRDRILYLMNYTFPFKNLSKEKFEQTLEQPMHMELPYEGDVPSRASLRGEAFVETKPGAALSKAIQKLAGQLASEKASAAANQGKKRGFFR